MSRYAVPHPTRGNLQARFCDDRLIFHGPPLHLEVVRRGDLVIANDGKHDIPIQHDVVGVVSALLEIDEGVATEFLRRFFELNFRLPYRTALEDWFKQVHPLLADIASRHPTLNMSVRLPRRLEEALRLDSLRKVAAFYWNEETCGPSSANAFAEALVIDSRITELKVSWMGLAPPTLRPELNDVSMAGLTNTFPVTPECRSLMSELDPRTSVAVVRKLMTDLTTPLVVLAGHQIGYKMSGRDPVRIVEDLKCAVRKSGFGRCRDFGEFLIKRGIAGNEVTEIKSSNDLVIAGTVLKNCLNNPSQPYRHGVLSGRYRVFCLGGDWGLGALAFDPNSWSLVEAKGKRNTPLSEEVLTDIDIALTEWRLRNAQ